ncbi:MAG: BON domain-containing protein [Duodenibacillus sp.]
MIKHLVLTFACLCAAASTLTGCAPLVVGGATVAGGKAVATMIDRRSTGAVVNDGVLEKRVGWEIDQALGDIDSHITVTTYNGRVLLTGEVATAEGKKIASETAKSSLDVASVVNELAVRPNQGLFDRMADSRLATTVRARIVATDEVYLSQMKVVVDRGIVYLMGIVTPQENTIAMTEAARTSKVQRVISVCEVMSAERIKQRLRDLQRERQEQEQAQSQK